jgi:hypothetical protein
LWIAIGMSWVEFKDRPINYQCEFRSTTGVVFFTSVFMALTTSKNYEIRRVAKGLRDEHPSFELTKTEFV